MLIRDINNYGFIRTANRLVLAIIAASSMSGLIATALQCPLPAPWRTESPGACPNAGPIYLYDGIMNIITDLQLCALSVAMVWDVKTSVKNRALVIALFSCRIL